MSKVQELEKLDQDQGILDRITESITELFPKLVKSILSNNSGLTPETLRQKYPNLTSEQIADKIIRNAKISVASVGFLSGLSNVIPNPVTIPASVMIDFTACTKIQIDTLNKVALAYGKQYNIDDPEDQIEVMLTIMGSSGLNAAITALAPRASQEITRQVIARTLPKTLTERVLLYFGRVTAKEALRRSISKWMPMGIGSVIGSSANVLFMSFWSSWLKSKFKIMGILRDELNLTKGLYTEDSILSVFEPEELKIFYHILWYLSEYNMKMSSTSNAFLSALQSITKVIPDAELRINIEGIQDKPGLFNSALKKNIFTNLCYFMAATCDKKHHKDIENFVKNILNTETFDKNKFNKYIEFVN